jgi:hypothetical protein
MGTRDSGGTRGRLDRRRLFALAGAGAAASLLPAGGMFRPGRAAAQELVVVEEDGTTRTQSIGESQITVWVEPTGHTMSGVLLDYWRVTGRDRFFGNPVSEPFETANGVWSQAMERGVIQFVPELAWTLEPFVRFMPVGRMLLGERSGGFRADGKRMHGGADLRAGEWALPPGTMLDGWVGVYGEMGAPVAEPFAGWYEAHEGRFYLGLPLTGLVQERGAVGQWFEGGLLLETADGPQLAPLGEELARRLGAPTDSVPQNGLPIDDESVFLSVANPAPGGGDPGAPGPKRVDVNVTQQRIDCFAGDQLALSSPISTGLWPNKTELGNFRVRYKKRFEDMRGATDENGKVVWIVGDGSNPPAGSIPYGVADVPDVLYINLQAEALHGAYWHNSFGQTMSHGCINLPPAVAAWVYDWAPLGTPVISFVEPGFVYPGAENATPEELRIAEEDGQSAGGV